MDAASEGTSPASESLWRRYSEFELLRNYLLVTYPFVVVPPLPEKRVSGASCVRACRHLWVSVADLCLLLLQAEFVWHKLSADNMDPDFVERRRVGLENFLLRVATHPALSNDKIFYSFLTEVTWEKIAKDPAYFIIP